MAATPADDDDEYEDVDELTVVLLKPEADKIGLQFAPANTDDPPEVLAIAPNSAAEACGLAVGDVLLEIGGVTVDSNVDVVPLDQRRHVPLSHLPTE